MLMHARRSSSTQMSVLLIKCVDSNADDMTFRGVKGVLASTARGTFRSTCVDAPHALLA